MSTGPFVSKVTSKSNTILKEKCEHYVRRHPVTGVKVLLGVLLLCRNCSMNSQQNYVNTM